ncbi:Uncharacterised protein [Mycobacteroides abscessus subsp. abscessus]|nr:Uncharacterised protein [Mycobacteroides abscessus subsp. abscessus]
MRSPARQGRHRVMVSRMFRSVSGKPLYLAASSNQR